MAFNHGKKQVFKLDNAAGSLQALSGYLTDCSLDRQLDLAEVTTLLKTAKVFVVGLEDGKFSIQGKWDPTLDGIITGVIAALKAGTIGDVSFEYGPAGDANGAVKYSGQCIPTNYNVSGSVGDAQSFSLDLQCNDDISVGTW